MIRSSFFPMKTKLKKGNALLPKVDKYQKPDNRVEYQLFNSEYFSGADVKIFLGDIWVDEAVDIQFQLSENVQAIYGYGSYTYDAIARGTRNVIGALTINFTSVGYLQQVINNAQAIFHALEEGEAKGIIQPQFYETMKLNEILLLLGKESFDQIADEFEQALWGNADDPNEYLAYANRSYFRQDDLGFDIRIQYGAISEASSKAQRDKYMKSAFERPNMTVDVLNGVQINGMTKQNISTSAQGAPIQETYQFMARDLNGVSVNQMARIKYGNNGNDFGQKRELETIYREMQYGPIR